MTYDLTPGLIAALIVAGVVAGFVNTMAGGGSVLTLPVLMLLGLPANVANGTNRVSVLAQSVAAVHAFHRRGRLDVAALPKIVLPTVVGAALGAYAAALVPAFLLKPILLGTMVIVALVLVLRRTPSIEQELPQPKTSVASTLGLFVAGLYGGFVQAGVGFLLLGVLVGVMRYDLVRANALKLACTGIFGGTALVVFTVAGQVAWVPGVVLAAATVVGANLGVRVAVRINPRLLKWLVFTAVLVTCVLALLKSTPSG